VNIRQAATPEATQQVLELVDSLYSRSRIVNSRRKRLDSNVNQQADRIFGILFKSAFVRKMNGPPQSMLGYLLQSATDVQKFSVINDRVANRTLYLDEAVELTCQLNKGFLIKGTPIYLTV
jgi:hypothetical protein